jgi:hypothetical protein
MWGMLGLGQAWQLKLIIKNHTQRKFYEQRRSNSTLDGAGDPSLT